MVLEGKRADKEPVGALGLEARVPQLLLLLRLVDGDDVFVTRLRCSEPCLAIGLGTLERLQAGFQMRGEVDVAQPYRSESFATVRALV